MSHDADFYGLEQLLGDAERDVLHRVRAFMEKEVAPVINRYWVTAQFPDELIPGLRGLGIAGLPYHGYGCPGGGCCWTGWSRWSWPGPTRPSPRSAACTAAWPWGRSTCADPRSRSSAGCRRWPGWS